MLFRSPLDRVIDVGMLISVRVTMGMRAQSGRFGFTMRRPAPMLSNSVQVITKANKRRKHAKTIVVPLRSYTKHARCYAVGSLSPPQLSLALRPSLFISSASRVHALLGRLVHSSLLFQSRGFFPYTSFASTFLAGLLSLVARRDVYSFEVTAHTLPSTP